MYEQIQSFLKTPADVFTLQRGFRFALWEAVKTGQITSISLELSWYKAGFRSFAGSWRVSHSLWLLGSGPLGFSLEVWGVCSSPSSSQARTPVWPPQTPDTCRSSAWLPTCAASPPVAPAAFLPHTLAEGDQRTLALLSGPSLLS